MQKLQKRYTFAKIISVTMFDTTQILVFRTDLRDRHSAQKLCKNLEDQGFAEKATVDMEDCDRVLRIESNRSEAEDIQQIAEEMGVRIEELIRKSLRFAPFNVVSSLGVISSLTVIATLVVIGRHWASFIV